MSLKNWAEKKFESAAGGERSRILPVEGLRGLAVSLVFFVHYYYAFHPLLPSVLGINQFGRIMAEIGHVGVDVFFLLSGYLIYGAVLNPRHRVLTFFGRRIERIHPTLLAVMGLYLLLSAAVPGRSKLPAGTWNQVVYLFQNILLIPGIFEIEPFIYVAWSLSYEALYYLMLPLMFLAFRIRAWPRYARIGFFSALMVTYGIFVYAQYPAHWPAVLLYPAHHIRLVFFGAGILLYELRTSANLRHQVDGRLRNALALAGFVTALAAVALLHPQVSPAVAALGMSKAAGEIIRTALLWPATFFLAASCLLSTGLNASLVNWKPLRWLGNISYSYYLIHGVTIMGIAKVTNYFLAGRSLTLPLYWLLVPFAFGATLVTSAVLFVLIEKPLSLSRHAHRREAKPVVAESSPARAQLSQSA